MRLPPCKLSLFATTRKQRLSIVHVNQSERNLIEISNGEIDGSETKTVDARELHTFLEVKSRFNDWIRNRISSFGFAEKFDFETLTKFLVSGGVTTEYALTVNMAKELAMVERTERGRMARLYFIECERRALNLAPATNRTDLGANIDSIEHRIARLEEDQAENRLLKNEQKSKNFDDGEMRHEILEFIRKNVTVPRWRVSKKMQHKLKSSEISRHIEALRTCGDIVVKRVPGKTKPTHFINCSS